MEPIISARGLGKSYRLRATSAKRYSTLRDDLVQVARDGLRGKWGRSRTEEFWALKDINLDIYPGEVVGIIGRNGAGKSTLLKILSRVVQPTTGQAILSGRVASLLEVGTGFHPELSGRENIFMSGVVLGMKRTEIRRKFDEIVAFAEVEKFLDTPVKRYSSGMYVRLAFAVAAHLEPEILLVDEVLAVGDAAFQKKCLGKMEDVSRNQGRTVLFVSHSMGTVAQLCNRAIMLQQGNIAHQGATKDIISFYLNNSSSQGRLLRQDSAETNKSIHISEVQTLNASGTTSSEFGHIEPIYVKITCKVNRAVRGTLLAISVKDRMGRKIFTSQTDSSPDITDLGLKDFVATVKIPDNFLTPGYYKLFIGLHVPMVEVLDQLDDICEFKVTDVGSELAMYEGSDYGCVFAKCQWKIEDL